MKVPKNILTPFYLKVFLGTEVLLILVEIFLYFTNPKFSDLPLMVTTLIVLTVINLLFGTVFSSIEKKKK